VRIDALVEGTGVRDLLFQRALVRYNAAGKHADEARYGVFSICS
jgi:hypothetical protein